MANNILSLVFDITMNSGQASAALKRFGELGATEADALRGKLQGIADAGNQAGTRFITSIEGTTGELRKFRDVIGGTGAKIDSYAEHGDRANARVAESFDRTRIAAERVKNIVPNVTRTFQEFGAKSAMSVKQLLPNLMTLRRMEFATLGLVSVGFYLSEWERLTKWIANAALELGGFNSQLQQMRADALSASDAFLYAGGNIAAMLEAASAKAKSTAEYDKMALQIQMKAAEQGGRNIQGQIANLAKMEQELKTRATFKMGDIWVTAPTNRQIAEHFGFSDSSSAYVKKKQKELDDALKSETQHASQLRTQLNLMALKGTEKAAKATDKLAKSMENFTNRMATARVQIPGLISEIRRLELSMSGVGETNRLYAAALENEYLRKHRRAGLSLEQMGIKLPKLQIPTDQIKIRMEAVRQLTAAERDQLPTESEIAIIRAQLAHITPNLTDEERRSTAAKIAAVPPIRRLIDEMAKESQIKAQSIRGSIAYGEATDKLAADHIKLARQVQEQLGLHRSANTSIWQAIFSYRALGQEILSVSQRMEKLNIAFDANNRHLSQAGRKQLELAHKNIQTANSLIKLAHAHEQARQSGVNDTKEQIAGLAMTAAATLLHGRELAIFEGTYYAAKAAVALAKLDFFAAAEYGLASALFFRAAGEAGRASSMATGGGGAGGGASRGTTAAHGLTGSPGEVGSLGHGGGSSSAIRHQTVINVYGSGVLDTHNIQNLVTNLNQGGQSGTIRLNISGTSTTIAEPSY